MFCIEFDTEQPELLIGLLSTYPFEGFQEFEERVEAYIESVAWNAIENDVLATIEGISTLRKADRLPDKNWNAVWEASFSPVIIDDFCAIRASFHPPITTCQHEIIIDPKMVFGTGHHETTELMIRQMHNMDFAGKTVLDLGCGTGILAILAVKLGATEVIAVDNDPEAVSNAKENSTINGVHITCIHGIIEDLPTHGYDRVLANINRNVLLEIMPDIKRVLRPDGILLLSGILVEDKAVIERTAHLENLYRQNEQSLGEWLSILMMVDK